ncbi:MAG: aminotransferase class I/II-fold pyridoxal phosphate-dependent enzyme [Microgenomates group bacterium]
MNNKLTTFLEENFNAAAPAPRIIDSSQGAYLTVDGKKLLNLCSSHYLGLGVNPRVTAAAKAAIDQYGIATGYRTLAGTHTLHVQLERALADFKGTEDAVIFTGGYMANCAAIQTIMTKEDVIISDELNHASIIDAVKLSGVKNKFIYKHGDMKHLEVILNEVKDLGVNQKILIVTDGVFSMDGDLAPLPQIVELAEKFDAIVMVDDAHGEGVLGNGGRGIVDHFKLHGRVDIEVGTLSKAFSVMGGFVAGNKSLISLYRQKARQFLFSNALTIPDTAAVLEGVRILSESDELVKKLWENANYLKSALKEAGFDTGKSESPITPIMLGDEDRAVKFASELFNEGIFASAIKFPMVPQGTARIRLIPSASHTKEDLEAAVSKIIIVNKTI